MAYPLSAGKIRWRFFDLPHCINYMYVGNDFWSSDINMSCLIFFLLLSLCISGWGHWGRSRMPGIRPQVSYHKWYPQHVVAGARSGELMKFLLVCRREFVRKRRNYYPWVCVAYVSRVWKDVLEIWDNFLNVRKNGVRHDLNSFLRSVCYGITFRHFFFFFQISLVGSCYN